VQKATCSCGSQCSHSTAWIKNISFHPDGCWVEVEYDDGRDVPSLWLAYQELGPFLEANAASAALHAFAALLRPVDTDKPSD
jgi:hypothetical protein